MEKLKVGFITNSAVGIKTGFQRSAQALISYLFKTNKYEIFHLVQSFSDGDPKLKMMPWKTQGVFTPEIVNTERFQKDGGFQRLVSYGNLAVEDWVIKNELDVVFHIEDIWSSHADFYWKKDWFQFIKNQFVNHTTLDSLPILPDALEWAKKIKNFWVWADFAEIAMKEIDSDLYKNVQTVYGTLDCNEFPILSKLEKSNLRKKFGIDDNTILVNMTSRNQLRKLFHCNIEALAKYKKIYPDGKKIKLLFHTSWTDGGGWPLERIRDEFNLNKDDILTTYFCQHCGEWGIHPFLGEPINCPYCKKEKSYITAGITSTINNKDLSKIYGICDAMSHQMTSGGLEYSIVEGLLCGLIVATNGYSSGLTFTKEKFVENIDFTLTRECGTAFYKSVPNPNSICRFFKKVADMPQEKRDEIGALGRKYILEKFHVDVIGKKVEDFIDSCNKLNWSEYHSFKREYDTKNPNADIDFSIESNSEFIISLYKNIMKMDVDENDTGFKSWFSNFQNVPNLNKEMEMSIRQKITNSFRQIASEHNQKNDSIEFKSLIDLDRPNKRGLIVIKESAGDCFIVTSLFKSFHEKYKGYDLYVATEPKFFETFQGNPYVHKLIPWHPIVENEMVMIGSGGDSKDAYFHFYGMPAISTQKVLNYLSHNNAGKIV